MKEVERLEKNFEANYFRDQKLAPVGTELRRGQEEICNASDWVAYRKGLRHIYFNVPDKDQRLRLIGKERQFRELRLKS